MLSLNWASYSQSRIERKAGNERAETKSGRSMSFSAFQFLLRKLSARRSWRRFPPTKYEVARGILVARNSLLCMSFRAQIETILFLRRKMIQGIKAALFFSTYFHVCLLPNSAGNKDSCGFVTCYFILPLKVSLFHIFLISLDRVEQWPAVLLASWSFCALFCE